jgi:hypothetical protein
MGRPHGASQKAKVQQQEQHIQELMNHIIGYAARAVQLCLLRAGSLLHEVDLFQKGLNSISLLRYHFIHVVCQVGCCCAAYHIFFVLAAASRAACLEKAKIDASWLTCHCITLSLSSKVFTSVKRFWTCCPGLSVAHVSMHWGQKVTKRSYGRSQLVLLHTCCVQKHDSAHM